ncbi:MAG TPA: DUF4168 domain-containing protein [Candidatus Binatia bacterium]|nr:DUF4168 domain-containing protein [Candidatus Binatia bacterium]
MRRRNLQAARALVVAIVISLTSAALALAQGSRVEHTKLSQSELEAFAKCYVQVGKILYAYESRVQHARTAEEGKDIYKEAVSKMQRALNEQGLTAARYVEIFEIARADDTLLETIVQLIREVNW